MMYWGLGLGFAVEIICVGVVVEEKRREEKTEVKSQLTKSATAATQSIVMCPAVPDGFLRTKLLSACIEQGFSPCKPLISGFMERT
jgi:hypothetical protein